MQNSAIKIEKNHFSIRHGFQATLEKQYVQASTGLTPDGVQSNKIDSSLLLNARAELATLQRAESIYRLTGNPRVNVEMERVIGDSFTKLRSDGSGLDYVLTTRARVVLEVILCILNILS